MLQRAEPEAVDGALAERVLRHAYLEAAQATDDASTVIQNRTSRRTVLSPHDGAVSTSGFEVISATLARMVT
jgi:hypothetical protein